MNIMLVSVLERVREIGIRVAIGARRADVMVQFLAEAATLLLAGGALGLALGVLAAFGTARFAGWPAVISPLAVTLALGSSLAVGLGFGFYPARRAAARPVDLPVEAGERPPEARVAELPGQPRRAIGGPLEPRRELAEVGPELGLHPPLDVLAEEIGQDHAGPGERTGDPHQRSGEKPEAQRSGRSR